MVRIENKVLNQINSSCAFAQEELIIESCVINNIEWNCFNPNFFISINNCIINKLHIYCAWFEGGFFFKNNIVKETVNYEMGGHNKKPFIMDGNVFLGFIDFFDCQFDAEVNITNNVFTKGTSLLGNKGQGFSNLFEHGYAIEGNIGKLDLDFEGQNT